MRATGAGDAIVRVDGLTKRFTARRSWLDTMRRPGAHEYVQVLRGVSLDVRRGEFFGLLGPNGAGKTTLFKILSTLVLPDAGSASIAGTDVTSAPAMVRRVLTPVIADERSLYWRLTAVENLELFAALYGLGADARLRIPELLELVGLSATGNRLVGTFSSGMKQRLLIARALLSRPLVLLLDEPTRSLDPVGARDFRQFLRENVVGGEGCTVILATHDADEAFELCDRLAVLDRGRVVASGTASELARLAGAQRYRALVSSPHRERAVAALSAVGWPTFTGGADGDDWTSLEGDLVGTTHDTARAIEQLVSNGVSVAEFARVPVSLADLVERLIQRGRSA